MFPLIPPLVFLQTPPTFAPLVITIAGRMVHELRAVILQVG